MPTGAGEAVRQGGALGAAVVAMEVLGSAMAQGCIVRAFYCVVGARLHAAATGVGIGSAGSAGQPNGLGGALSNPYRLGLCLSRLGSALHSPSGESKGDILVSNYHKQCVL